MRLSGWQLPLEQLSASSLSLAIQCPEQFRLRKIKKVPEKLYAHRFMGIVDHAVHEENFLQKMETGEDLDIEWMRGKYRAKWDTTLDKEGEPEWEADDPEELKNQGLLMMERYHTEVSPNLKPQAVEQRFEMPIRGVPVPLVGYLDLVTERVIERKTTKQKQAKPKSQWRFQGRVYQLVTDMDVEWHVITKQKEPKIYTAENEPGLLLKRTNNDVTVGMIQNTAERINDLYARFGPDTPWPTEGLFHDWLCDYCGFGPKGTSVCVAWRDL